MGDRSTVNLNGKRTPSQQNVNSFFFFFFPKNKIAPSLKVKSLKKKKIQETNWQWTW